MKAQKLPNGNLLVPAMAMINGMMFCGYKEVAPGTPDYVEWSAETVRTTRNTVEKQSA